MKTQITFLSIILAMGFGFNPECSGQLSITTDTVLQTSLCAGGTVIIPYTVSGGNYNFGNVFTAQLSQDNDMGCFMGTFSNPVNIGTTPYWSSGFVIGTVPVNTTMGAYRVRVISSSPADTGSISPNCVFIANLPQLVVTIIASDDTICEGDSAILSVLPLPAASYKWSTGETAESITVTQSGSYFVTVTDTLGCETTSDTLDIVAEDCSGTGITENKLQNSVSVYPNPGRGVFTIECQMSDVSKRSPMDKCQMLEVSVFNVLGSVILKSKITNQKSEIDLSGQPAGIYYLQGLTESGLITRKIVLL